jgi:predicted ferric reductase
LVERRYGLDSLLAAHRLTGIATALLLVVHLTSVLIAYRMPLGNPVSGVWNGVVGLWGTGWMPAAFVGGILMFMVALTSWRRIKRSLDYETWYFLHLLGYLGVVLAVGHQFTIGTDLANDPFAIAWWAALNLAVLGLVLSRLVRALGDQIQHRGTVSAIDADGGCVVLTIRTHGRHPEYRAGQFFQLRIFTRDLWWHSHPFSVSAAPDGQHLRFTIRPTGDATTAMTRLRVGTRITVTGPFGRFTTQKAAGRPIALIGAGSGLAPMVGMLDESTSAQRPVVLARAPRADAVPHRVELIHGCSARGGRYLEVTGRTRDLAVDPFGPALVQAVPDIAERDVFLCGPEAFTSAAVRGLRRAGVPSQRIHRERFGY